MQPSQRLLPVGLALLLAAFSALPGFSWEASGGSAKPSVEQTPAPTFPDKTLWGDLHLHTNQSFDAFAYGLTSMTPDEAYRFAKGEEITSQTGLRAQLKKPLDFLMVADHAEFIGVMSATQENDPLLSDNPVGKRWLDYARNGKFGSIFAEVAGDDVGRGKAPLPNKEFRESSWARVVNKAEAYYEPGKFTTFAGYEWTSTKGRAILHRVVMYADGPERTNNVQPFTSLDSNNPEDLWRALESYQEVTGGSALSIPHNGNQSRGTMFDTTTFSGESFSEGYANLRRKFEPVIEVTQVKGDGETHPALSTDDEFADFENWSAADVEARQATDDEPEVGIDWIMGGYGRGALLRGLSIKSELGINPYEFGMIGSTDMHTGLSAAAEDNFFGKFADSEPSEKRLSGKLGGQWWPNVNLSAAGYIAVWAGENTREDIFAAIKRREVYASTGPRIKLRFFGGWNLPAKLPARKLLAKIGYDQGVPMGGVLPAGKGNAAPKFFVSALMDPDAARLDRIQIVKGWLDTSGELQERVFDVAVSDGRRIDPSTWRAPALPDTVNPRTAGYDTSIGAVELRASWRDPQFDPAEEAFYYARVLQVSTPRWSTYDAVKYDLPLPDSRPASIQDRVYSSPIWYHAR